MQLTLDATCCGCFICTQPYFAGAAKSFGVQKFSTKKMSMEASDQEEEEVEEVMEAEIVSLTLDPPPANAATVLHQHHLHHHSHHHGPNTSDHYDVNSSCNCESNSVATQQKNKQNENVWSQDKTVTNNGEVTIKQDNYVSCEVVSRTTIPDDDDEGPQILLQSSTVKDKGTSLIKPLNDSPPLDSMSGQTGSQRKKFELLPKKSSFSCLKARKLDGGEEQKKPRRNVKFPADENLVTMKVEPVDPWKNAKVASSGEVIFEYKKMCKQTKTKAIDNVVRQLQDLPDLSNRIATLSLKGVKLDSKACEALEAVFKRVRFEVIDFENCGLEEEGATALLEMIEFYQSARKVSVAMNPKMGMRGWQTLCRMLRKTPCLHSLDARRTMLTDQTMPMFGRCLKADPHVRTLHLEGVFLSGRPLLILTTALKYNTLLEELYLGDNDLQPADGVSIGTMLSANKTLQLLDLRNNSFRDAGLVHIANGLTDQANFESGGVGSIVLWNLGLTHEAMFGFCDALAKSRSLRSLNLGQNRLGDLGIQKIKPGLIRNRSLCKLGLLNTRIGNEGAVALAEILADSISLSRIDVRENHVQIAGLMAISLALKVNQSLTRIDLDKELRKEPGLETVQQSVLADIYNFCHRNKQIARESISRESSTSEDSESLMSHEFSEKESDDERNETYEDFTKNPQILSTLQSLASKDTVKQETSSEATNVLPRGVYKPTVADIHKNSVTPKPRFTITRILDTIGSASADVANKLASVRMDSSSKTKESSNPSAANSSQPTGNKRRESFEDKHKESPWKNLQRQPNVETPSCPTLEEDAPASTRSRNMELKEFYRKLKDGEIDHPHGTVEDNGKVSNELKVDNHIDKMPFPGKAKKLKDVSIENTSVTEGLCIDTKQNTNDLLGTESTVNNQAISNGPVGVE